MLVELNPGILQRYPLPESQSFTLHRRGVFVLSLARGGKQEQ